MFIELLLYDSMVLKPICSAVNKTDNKSLPSCEGRQTINKPISCYMALKTILRALFSPLNDLGSPCKTLSRGMI